MDDNGESLFTALGIDEYYDRCIVRVAHVLEVTSRKLPRRWRWVQWEWLHLPFKFRFRILERHGFGSALDDIPWKPSNMPIGHRTTVRTPMPAVYIRTSKKS